MSKYKNAERNQMMVLDQICAKPGRSSAEIAIVVGLTPNGVACSARSMLGTGLVTSIMTTGRAPKSIWSPTEKGKAERLAYFGKGHKTKTTAEKPAPKFIPVKNSNAKGKYLAPELKDYDGRPGAMDAFKLPSLYGSRLRYRDGREVARAQT